MMERRKVLFTYGMSHDAMIIITDATKKRIEQVCCLKKTMEYGIGNAVDCLKVTNYVKELFDSEVDENEDIEVIGYDEVYDLTTYFKLINDRELDEKEVVEEMNKYYTIVNLIDDMALGNTPIDTDLLEQLTEEAGFKMKDIADANDFHGNNWMGVIAKCRELHEIGYRTKVEE